MNTVKRFKIIFKNFPIIFRELSKPKKIIVSLAFLGIAFGSGNMIFFFLNYI